MNFYLNLTPYTKMNSESFVVLKVKGKTIQLWKETQEKKLVFHFSNHCDMPWVELVEYKAYIKQHHTPKEKIGSIFF